MSSTNSDHAPPPASELMDGPGGPEVVETTSRPGLDTLAAVMRSLGAIRGRGAVAEYLFARLKKDPGLWSIKMNDGSIMTVPRSAEMSWIPAFTGAYDQTQLDLILRFLDRDTFALDVGACFGFYAVPMGMAAARRNAQVLAFEALGRNERLLRHNLRQNKVENIVVSLPVALGRTKTIVEMLVEGGGVGNAFVRTDGFKDGRERRALAENVSVERLDDQPWLRWTLKSRCSLIKMDIEGFELEALAGGEAFIDKHRPVIFGEFNAWFLERHGFSADAPLDWAREHRYACFDLLRSRQGPMTDSVVLTPQLLGHKATRAGGDLLLLPVENPSLVSRFSGQRRPPRPVLPAPQPVPAGDTPGGAEANDRAGRPLP